MSVESLHQVLQETASKTYANETSFVVDAIPKFVRALGYDESLLLFQHFLGHETRYVADAVVIEPTSMRPWLLIEAKGPQFSRSKRYAEMAGEQLQAYRSAAKPDYAIMFAPGHLWIYHGDSVTRFALDSLTREQSAEIYRELACPNVRTTEPAASAKVPRSTSLLNYRYFSINSTVLDAQVDAAENASSNKEKGDTFEELAATLFSALRGVRVKHRNLLGSSHELDLVLEHSSDEAGPLFADFGRYSLVECKNWATPMEAKHVRDFKTKLDRTRVRLGFIMSRNGVTGLHNGADALREIRAAVDATGTYLVVVSLADIKTIAAGTDFYSLLDERVDRLRFDF